MHHISHLVGHEGMGSLLQLLICAGSSLLSSQLLAPAPRSQLERNNARLRAGPL